MAVIEPGSRARALMAWAALLARWFERPWLLRLAIASSFASAVFYYLRAFHTSRGDEADLVRAVVAGPVICGLVWTLHRVAASQPTPRAPLFAWRRLGLVAVATLLAWLAVWGAARVLVTLVAPGAAPVLDGGGYTAVALGSAMALNAVIARARRSAAHHSAA